MNWACVVKGAGRRAGDVPAREGAEMAEECIIGDLTFASFVCVFALLLEGAGWRKGGEPEAAGCGTLILIFPDGLEYCKRVSGGGRSDISCLK